MPDPAIKQFFDERKEGWLKKKIKSSMSDEEVAQLEEECGSVFSLEKWLPDAAKRAGQISISSHPCTFSHPSARKNKNGYVSSIICQSSYSADGLLKSGNVNVENDALGNAAALDVYKFLGLTMENGETLLEHIQKDSSFARDILSVSTESYENLRSGFLAMKESDAENITSSKIKQIYFPVDDDYHQLSLLVNSGIVFEMRRRLDDIRFSEESKSLREKKRNNEYSETGFSEIYNLTTIGYGGTKPQNISVLNNQNGGKAHLLLSVPPALEKRDIRFPIRNFFMESIRYYDAYESLKKLHGIFLMGVDSEIPRRHQQSGRDHRVEDILETIMHKAWQCRSVAANQYREESSELPLYQKIWLCDGYQEERETTKDWLDHLTQEITRWIHAAYKKVIKKPVTLGPKEIEYINTFIDGHREALR